MMSRGDRLITLLDGLVAMPTIAGTSNADLVNDVAEQLAAHGVEATLIPSYTREDAFNLHAVIGPADVAGVLLSAHTDVVAVDGQAWRSDPFALTRVDTRLYGRGTTDMKGFIAAVLAVAPDAVASGLQRPLHIALSCDEELGCQGVGSLVDFISNSFPAPVYGIVGEPTQMRVVDRHKGKVAWTVDVHGRALHSSMAPLGVNAVTSAARLIVALDELAGDLSQAVGDGGFEVDHATLSVGPIQGGVVTNIVPDACSFQFELRYLPGQDVAAIETQVRAHASALEEEMRRAAPEAAIVIHPTAAYPPLGRWSGKPVRIPGEGERPRLGVTFGTEAGLYSERLGVPMMIWGPGDMNRAHRADEFIELGELETAEAMLHDVVNGLRVG